MSDLHRFLSLDEDLDEHARHRRGLIHEVRERHFDATRLGLEPNAFLKVARESAAYSQVMDTKGRKMIESDFRAQGRARQHLKDVHLMLDQANKVGQPLPQAPHIQHVARRRHERIDRADRALHP